MVALGSRRLPRNAASQVRVWLRELCCMTNPFSFLVFCHYSTVHCQMMADNAIIRFGPPKPWENIKILFFNGIIFCGTVTWPVFNDIKPLIQFHVDSNRLRANKRSQPAQRDKANKESQSRNQILRG